MHERASAGFNEIDEGIGQPWSHRGTGGAAELREAAVSEFVSADGVGSGLVASPFGKEFSGVRPSSGTATSDSSKSSASVNAFLASRLAARASSESIRAAISTCLPRPPLKVTTEDTRG